MSIVPGSPHSGQFSIMWIAPLAASEVSLWCLLVPTPPCIVGSDRYRAHAGAGAVGGHQSRVRPSSRPLAAPLAGVEICALTVFLGVRTVGLAQLAVALVSPAAIGSQASSARPC